MTKKNKLFSFEKLDSNCKKEALKAFGNERPGVKDTNYGKLHLFCRNKGFKTSKVLDFVYGKKVKLFTFKELDKICKKEVLNAFGNERPGLKNKEYLRFVNYCSRKNKSFSNILNEIYGKRSTFTFTKLDNLCKEEALKVFGNKKPGTNHEKYPILNRHAYKNGLKISEIFNFIYKKKYQ